jgi:hypothetical protein
MSSPLSREQSITRRGCPWVFISSGHAVVLVDRIATVGDVGGRARHISFALS